MLAHGLDGRRSRRVAKLREIERRGERPRIETLAHSLASEESALRIEAAVIDLLGQDEIVNDVRGWRSVELGRVSLADLVACCAAKPGAVRHPSLLIRVNRLYRHGMSARELHEATRGVWRLGPRRQRARLAFAVFESVAREVCPSDSWQPAGSTKYTTRVNPEVDIPGRSDSVGRTAGASIRRRYVGRSVASSLRAGSQNPVTYVGC